MAVTVNPATTKLPNVVNPVPLPGGWEEGPLQYFKQQYPKDIDAVGTIISNQAGRPLAVGRRGVRPEEGGLQDHLRARHPGDPDATSPNVIAMKNAGVKLLFLDQLPEIYTSAVLKALAAAGLPPAGDPGGGELQQLAGDQLRGRRATSTGRPSTRTRPSTWARKPVIPSVDTFNKWVKIASPGSRPTSSPSTAGCRPSCSPMP